VTLRSHSATANLSLGRTLKTNAFVYSVIWNEVISVRSYHVFTTFASNSEYFRNDAKRTQAVTADDRAMKSYAIYRMVKFMTTSSDLEGTRVIFFLGFLVKIAITTTAVYQQQFVKLTACIRLSASSKIICLLCFND